MKPTALLYAGLLFVVVVVSFGGWYGALVSDYADYNATTDVNMSRLPHEAILREVNETRETQQSGLTSAISQIPVIGDTLVQVINVGQMLKNFMDATLATIDIGLDILGNIHELIPIAIPQAVQDVLVVALGLALIGAVVYMILNREVD